MDSQSLSESVRASTRSGKKGHKLRRKLLVIGGKLIHALAGTQGRAHKQLVIVERNPQLAGEHLANLVSLGAKIARDGDHHGLAGAIDIGAGGTHLKTALKPRLGDDTHESSSLLCNNLGRKQLCGNDAALVRAHNKRDAKIQNEV